MHNNNNTQLSHYLIICKMLLRIIKRMKIKEIRKKILYD